MSRKKQRASKIFLHPLRNRPRGLFLVKVFLAVLIFFTILAGGASMLTVHTHLAIHRENHHRAQLAAESALNEAITLLLEDKDYHQDVTFQDESVEETAILTFNKAKPFYSSNNARGATAVEGSNGPVFPNMAHLVAVGQCRQTRYVAEAVIVFQRFPYALASTGRIVSEGKLEVFGVDTFADTQGGIADDEKKPGHIVSNLAEPDSVILNPLAVIEGDVCSSGGILENGATIRGAKKTGQGAADLPELKIEDYDPRRYSDDYTAEISLGALAGQTDVKISNQRLRVNANGNEVVINNGLTLDDGLLYVEGDLVIRGGVKGKGALAATGKITIIGQSSIDGDMMALVSGGGVNIDGQGLGISSFRGMVATLGDFQADSTSVMGAYLALGKDPTTQIGTSTMTLRDVQSVHAPDVTKIDIVGHVKLQEMFEGSQSSDDTSGNQIGLLLPNGTFYTFTVPKNLGESQAAYEARRAPIIAATYEALKGPTDGTPHPMENGRVIVRDANGNEIPDGSLSSGVRLTFQEMRAGWNNYLSAVKNGNVETVPIFSIDLNRFTSGYNRVKILTYGEKVSEQ